MKCVSNHLMELGRISIMEYDIETIPAIKPIRLKSLSPKCAANTGVGVDISPHCFIKCPNGLASYTASGSKV